MPMLTNPKVFDAGCGANSKSAVVMAVIAPGEMLQVDMPLDHVQSLHVDNVSGTVAVCISFPGRFRTIVVPAGSEGCFPAYNSGSALTVQHASLTETAHVRIRAFNCEQYLFERVPGTVAMPGGSYVTNSPTGSYRFWRLLLLAVDPAAGNYGFDEVRMAQATAGANLCTVGSNAFAATENSSTYAAAKAVAGDPGRYVSAGTNGLQTWGYDFGSGNNYVIKEVVIVPTDQYPFSSPALFNLQGSATDVVGTYTNVHSFTAATWQAGTPQTFTVP